MLLLLLAACGGETYDVADLQMDVDASLPEGTEILHICVADVGDRNEGAGNGRVAMPGLPADGPLTVTVEAWDVENVVLGRTEPTVFDAEQPWRRVPLLAPDGTSCKTDREFVAADGEAWLFAVRFLDEEPVFAP